MNRRSTRASRKVATTPKKATRRLPRATPRPTTDQVSLSQPSQAAAESLDNQRERFVSFELPQIMGVWRQRFQRDPDVAICAGYAWRRLKMQESLDDILGSFERIPVPIVTVPPNQPPTPVDETRELTALGSIQNDPVKLTEPA